MWRLDIFGISDSVQMNDNDKALKQFIMMENDIRLSGHGRALNLTYLIIMMWLMEE